MTKAKKELLSKAPWRGEDDDESNKFKDANSKSPANLAPRLLCTSLVRRTNVLTMKMMMIKPLKLTQNFVTASSATFRYFSDCTLALPPAMAYNVSRNLSFFTRIFTQFFEILGLGQEENTRRVR
ncbi:Zinc finger and BTB domain-containing protein [Salix suchowensis]|nr:Zinc finger and BTB domain-containing protein [Salix suchowensis]